MKIWLIFCRLDLHPLMCSACKFLNLKVENQSWTRNCHCNCKIFFRSSILLFTKAILKLFSGLYNLHAILKANWRMSYLWTCLFYFFTFINMLVALIRTLFSHFTIFLKVNLFWEMVISNFYRLNCRFSFFVSTSLNLFGTAHSWSRI